MGLAPKELNQRTEFNLQTRYSSFISPDNFYYFDNNVFHKKRYELTINDYEIAAVGSPDDFYPKTDLDFSYSFQNNELNLQAEGANHTSCAFRLAVNDGSWPFVNGIAAAYFWEFVFNSKSLDPLKIPELPEELKDWEINSVYEQKAFKLEQIKIARYENLLDYKDYLDKVIKNNKKWYLVSPKRESVFKKEPNTSYWNSFLIN